MCSVFNTFSLALPQPMGPSGDYSILDLSHLCSNSKTNLFPNLLKALAGKTRIPKLRSL